MVVVRCLILCSKFSKNRLSAGFRPDPLGNLQRSPRPVSWIMRKGGVKGDGRAGEEEGKGVGEWMGRGGERRSILPE